MLPIAQFAYNNSTAVTGISPYYANYGRHPSIDKDARGMKPLAGKARISVEKLRSLHDMMKDELKKISEKTTIRANKKRSEGPDFQGGEKVYLLRKNIKTQKQNNKLDHTKIGPYKIKNKLGLVTFELELPAGLRIHPVFHKSLLEKAPQDATPGPVLIHEETQEPMYDVEALVGWDGAKQYLVKWLEYGHSEDTWEPAGNLPPQMIRKYQQQFKRRPKGEHWLAEHKGPPLTLSTMNQEDPPPSHE